jgi:hypothetical protein
VSRAKIGYAPLVGNADPRPMRIGACGCGTFIPPWRFECMPCHARFVARFGIAEEEDFI